MNMNFAKFPVPVLGDDMQSLYTGLYGEAGERFVDILSTSPDESRVGLGAGAALRGPVEISKI